MLASGLVLGFSTTATAFVPGYLSLALLMVPVGASMGAFQMLNNALVMRESEPAFYGRVMSLTMLAWGLNSLAGLPFGMLADSAGERESLVVMGGLAILVAGATMLAFAPIRKQASQTQKTPAA